MKSLVTPGEHQTVGSRRMAYFMKCPMRDRLSKDKATTHPSLIFEEILDTSFSYLFVRDISSIRTNLDHVLKHGRALVIERMPDIYQETYIAELTEFMTKFMANYESFKHVNQLALPPFEMELSSHAVTLKLLVNLGIKKKTSGLPITRYLFFDYSKLPGSSTWNIYPKLWAAGAKMLLQQQGISTIEVGVLNIPSGKYLPIKYSSTSRVNEIISDACLSYSSHMEHPIFGGHCNQCIVREQCSMITSI